MTVLTFNRGLSSVVSKEILTELTEVRNNIPKTIPWASDVADRFERLARIAKTAQLRSLRKMLAAIARGAKALNTNPTEELLDATQKTLHSVLNHLQEMVQDHKNTPMKMSKVLQTLMQSLGEKVSPTLSAELYLPYIPEDVSPARPTELSMEAYQGYVQEHRAVYHQSLRSLMKDMDLSALVPMRQALLTLEPKNPSLGYRVFFESAIAVFDRLIKTNQLDNVGKWIVANIDNELTKIEKGSTKADEDLLSVILYVVARAEPESGARMRILQEHFNLKSYLSDSADSAVVEKFVSVLVKARELWSQNNKQEIDHMAKLINELNSKAPLLKNPGFTYVVTALNDVLIALQNKSAVIDDDQLALEGASALLTLEQQLREGPSMDMAHASAARLYSLIGKQVEIVSQDNQTATVILHRLAAEVQEDLDQLEPKILEVFSGHTDAETDFRNGLKKVAKIIRILGKDNPLSAAIVKFENDFTIPDDSETKAEIATRYTQLGSLVDHLKTSEKAAFAAAQKWLDQFNTPAAIEESDVDETIDSPNDAEMMEIFLEEAETILIDLEKWIKALKTDHSDHEMLVNIRRGYHTLKGSGRMVGLGRFGDLAYITELLLNNWIQSKKIPNNELLSFVDESTARITKHVDEFKKSGTSSVVFDDMNIRAVELGGTQLSDAPQTKKTSKKLSTSASKAVDVATPAEIVKPVEVVSAVAVVEEHAPIEVQMDPVVIEPTIEVTFESVDIENKDTTCIPEMIVPESVAEEAAPVVLETTVETTPVAEPAPVTLEPVSLDPVAAEPAPVTLEPISLDPVAAEPAPVTLEPISLDPVVAEPAAVIDSAPAVAEVAPTAVIESKQEAPVQAQPRKKRETPDAWKQQPSTKQAKKEIAKKEPVVEQTPIEPTRTPAPAPAVENKGFMAKIIAFFAGLFGGKK